MFCNWECPVIIFKEKSGKECVVLFSPIVCFVEQMVT